MPSELIDTDTEATASHAVLARTCATRLEQVLNALPDADAWTVIVRPEDTRTFLRADHDDADGFAQRAGTMVFTGGQIHLSTDDATAIFDADEAWEAVALFTALLARATRG